MSVAPLLQLSHVWRTFDSGQGGIRDVTLSIEQGELVAIVGPSGAGKSTLLNVIGLLDRQDAGDIRFDGVDVGSLSESERNRLRSTRIGFVFQSSFVLGDQSTLWNTALGLRIQGVGLARRSAQAARALRQLGVLHKWSTRAGNLSGGERQRVAIARAITTRPALILADEPTGNLDRGNGELVMSHLRALVQQGVTVILITHDRELARRADRQISLVDGHASDVPVGVAAQPAQALTPYLAPPRRRGAREGALDDVADAIAALGSRVLRSALLVTAFALGIGGLVASMGVSESASAQIADRLSAAALDEVRVGVPGGSALLGADDERLADWIVSIQALPHVRSAGYVAVISNSAAQIHRLDPTEADPQTEYFVASASPAYLDMMGVTDGSGADTDLLGEPRLHDAVWIGRDASAGLGTAAPGPGSNIWATGRQLDLVGLVDAGDRNPSLDRYVFVSPDVLAGLRDVGVTIVVRTEVGYPAAVADAIPLTLDPVNAGQFTVETVSDLRALRFGVADDLGVLIGLLSVVVLFLAIISASTTMYLSVQARSHEIALRRALGSSRSGVGRLFVLEGAIVGIAGGAAGAVLGTAAVLLATVSRGWDPVLPAEIAPLGIALGAATGLASSMPPAWIAARKEPATALRD